MGTLGVIDSERQRQAPREPAAAGLNHGEAGRSAPAARRAGRRRRRRRAAAREPPPAAAAADRDARHGVVARQGGRARAPRLARRRRRRRPRARPQRR